MLHHYLEFIDEESVAEAGRWSQELSARYSELESGTFNGTNSYSSGSCGSGSGSGSDNNLQSRMSPGDSSNKNYINRPQQKIPILFPSF